MSAELEAKAVELTDEDVEKVTGGVGLFLKDEVDYNAATCNHECPYESAIKKPCDTCEFSEGITTAATLC